MKLTLLKTLALPLLLLSASACTGPIAAEQDPIAIYPQVRVTSYWLQTWTKIQPPVVSRVGSNQIEVAVPIRNLTDDDVVIDYQYRFLFNGAQAEDPSGWHNLRIPRKGIAEIRFTSMTAKPNDFDVMIRYRR